MFPTVVLAALALVAVQPPAGGPPPMDSAQRKVLAPYRPVLNLMGFVVHLDRLTGDGRLSLSAAEGTAVRRRLVALAGRKALSPADAAAALTALRAALSPTHLKAVDAAAPPGGPDGPPPPPPPSGDGPPPPPPPGKPGGIFAAMAQGKPVNPLAPDDPVVGAATARLIARLGKASR